MSVFKNFFHKMRGAAAIEFAFVLPVFLLVIFGCIEFGYIFWADASLKYGATYGARYAFVNPTASNSDIQNFALSKVDPGGSVINYTVTGAGGLSVDIDGTFSYTFLVVPLSPITLTVHQHQVLPLSS